MTDAPFLATGDPHGVSGLGRRFLGPEIALAESAGLVAEGVRQGATS